MDLSVVSRLHSELWPRKCSIKLCYLGSVSENLLSRLHVWQFVIQTSCLTAWPYVLHWRWPYHNSHLTKHNCHRAEMLCDKSCWCFEFLKIYLVIVKKKVEEGVNFTLTILISKCTSEKLQPFGIKVFCQPLLCSSLSLVCSLCHKPAKVTHEFCLLSIFSELLTLRCQFLCDFLYSVLFHMDLKWVAFENLWEGF